MNDPPLACKLAIEELIKGQASADRLKALLLEISPCASYRSLASELIDGISSSFSRSLFVLDSGERSEVCQSRNATPSVGRKRIPERANGGTTISKRRRTNSHSTKQITSNKIEDGFSWRKYGQKTIYSSKHPRSYYRCTYKHDRGCQAIKQVQRSEEDDSLFLIAYIGDHTCRNNDNDASNSFAVAASDGTPPMISFGSGGGGAAAAASDKLDSSFSSLVQEAEEEVLSSFTAGSSLSGLFAPAPVHADMEFIVDPFGFDFNGVFSFDDEDENL